MAGMSTGRDALGRLSLGSMEDGLVRDPRGWRILRRGLTRVYERDVQLPGKVTVRDAASWLSLYGPPERG